MKLSLAIRLGAMLRPQITETYFSPPLNVERTCALGAALSAVIEGILVDSHRVVWREELVKRWPYLQNKTHCPDCSDLDEPLHRVVTHLSDLHRWTRERIADQVEVWERDLEPQEAEAVGEEARQQQEAVG